MVVDEVFEDAQLLIQEYLLVDGSPELLQFGIAVGGEADAGEVEVDQFVEGFPELFVLDDGLAVLSRRFFDFEQLPVDLFSRLLVLLIGIECGFELQVVHFDAELLVLMFVVVDHLLEFVLQLTLMFLVVDAGDPESGFLPGHGGEAVDVLLVLRSCLLLGALTILLPVLFGLVVGVLGRLLLAFLSLHGHVGPPLLQLHLPLQVVLLPRAAHLYLRLGTMLREIVVFGTLGVADRALQVRGQFALDLVVVDEGGRTAEGRLPPLLGLPTARLLGAVYPAH